MTCRALIPFRCREGECLTTEIWHARTTTVPRRRGARGGGGGRAPAAAPPPALAAGTTERVSVSSHGVQGNGDSTGPAFSADGHVVAFVSDAKNLAPGDP